jgi:hypothetical protein
VSNRSGLILLIIGVWLALAGGASVRAFFGLPIDTGAQRLSGGARQRLLYLGVLLVVLGIAFALRGVLRI